ncbi:Arginine deiminase [Alkaliphilus metalliredigens QYMF]|uniref:Arginine deiminase n=1 Tax=Alkaliphilus metalliredigens (strain QYMF) TaxID=293826 RepID=A6TWW2_ALKMQ|nr:arginine deiminase [Alkaliphilus metalliredigens]ABR50680.1 Arginine deiminase [Alkaliphilus metalliredigens QYMF]
MEKGFLNITSEIGNLKAVLLHRPGKELERLTPGYLEELLFDDIPWLKRMQEEHDDFAKVMKARGSKIYYYETLLADVLRDEHIKNQFVVDVIKNSHVGNIELEKIIIEYLQGERPESIVEIAISGLHKEDFPKMEREFHLVDYVKYDYPFYINPLPNLYFTRDPGAVIGQGLSVNKMKTPARDRETMFLSYIYRHHPLFKEKGTSLWYDYQEHYPMEGGDILVLSDEVVALGCSERTTARGIEILAQRLFAKGKVKKVLVIQIPFTRAYMHLDTVFTMVDHDKFTIYPGVENAVRVYELTQGVTTPKVTPKESLEKALMEVLHLPAVQLIQSGGGDEITAAREQWNDSTNTLAIAPGTVITYNRNEATNDTLRKHGIEVIEIEGSELVRGRGGPRCMSMPLLREEL